jgi:glycosyltransferase involved in cell wall biosynthesis
MSAGVVRDLKADAYALSQAVEPVPKKLRALHVHAGNMYGGVETMLLTQVRRRSLCPSLETSFALCFEGRFSQELVAAGAAVQLLNPVRIRQPWSVRRARSKFRELLKHQTFDAVVTHSSWSQAIFGPVAREHGVALVFYMHGPATGRYWLERLARRTVPDAVLCNSKFTAATSTQLYPTIRPQVVYCPVAAPDHRFSPADREQTRAELDTPRDATVIIQVSRMEAWKGQARHLAALRMLRDLPNWMCWQVGGAQGAGEKRYLDGLKNDARQFGISDRVRFLDQRADVARLLRSADIFCQPNTEPEPFGIVFIEALYAELPIVTTNFGGAREIVDESCGILVRRDDVRELSESLRRLITEIPYRKALGSAGPGRAQHLSAPETQLDRFHEALISTLDR